VKRARSEKGGNWMQCGQGKGCAPAWPRFASAAPLTAAPPRCLRQAAEPRAPRTQARRVPGHWQLAGPCAVCAPRGSTAPPCSPAKRRSPPPLWPTSDRPAAQTPQRRRSPRWPHGWGAQATLPRQPLEGPPRKTHACWHSQVAAGFSGVSLASACPWKVSS